MIKITCDYCGKELDALGALLFSPPDENQVKKYHICYDCFNNTVKPNTKKHDFVNMALKINQMVHDNCKDVPHDMGLRIINYIEAYLKLDPALPMIDGWACWKNQLLQDEITSHKRK